MVRTDKLNFNQKIERAKNFLIDCAKEEKRALNRQSVNVFMMLYVLNLLKDDK